MPREPLVGEIENTPKTRRRSRTRHLTKTPTYGSVKRWSEAKAADKIAYFAEKLNALGLIKPGTTEKHLEEAIGMCFDVVGFEKV